VALGEPGARLGQEMDERPLALGGRLVEDDGHDVGHDHEYRSPPIAFGGPRVRRVRAFIGLGANLGDAPATLARAARALADLPGTRLVGVSGLYRTRPVGVAEQPDFHNAVVALEVPGGATPQDGALALLVALKRLERSFGRHERGRWGPRELDLDLLVFGEHEVRIERPEAVRSEDPARADVQWMEVPHPSARERLFVLAPLAELEPELVPQGWTETVASAAARRQREEGPDAVERVARWADAGWLPS
jgi:2-amino-4-hydroxy-6-hydroxymethyldihydropteridine diphosphokinase